MLITLIFIITLLALYFIIKSKKQPHQVFTPPDVKRNTASYNAHLMDAQPSRITNNFSPVKIVENDNELENIVPDFHTRRENKIVELTANIGKALPNDVIWGILQDLTLEYILKDHKVFINTSYQQGLLLQKEKKYKQAITHYSYGLYYLMNFYKTDFNPTPHIIDFVRNETQLIEMAQYKFINKIQVCMKEEELTVDEVKDLSHRLIKESSLPYLNFEQFFATIEPHVRVKNKVEYEDIPIVSTQNKLISELNNANVMKEQWLNTTSDSEVEENAMSFWDRHSKELQTGEFWADRIKKFKGEPAKRLLLALENLPLPASFREGAIAIRSIIREKRKVKANYEEELALLYWLAAINSFSIPYSEVLETPGYNVIETIPGAKLKALQFSYNDLGYEALVLLNKTDIKWLIEALGEPKHHSTLHEIHIDLWREYENKLQAKRQRRMTDLLKNIKSSNL